MPKKFTVINHFNNYFAHILEYQAPMMEGGEALGVILKIGEGNSKAFYYHEVEEWSLGNISGSAYSQWDEKGADFGGFATSLFSTYRIADSRNKERIRVAFPDYFEGPTSLEYNPVLGVKGMAVTAEDCEI